MPFNLAAQANPAPAVVDASNPASGVHNIPLQGGIGAEVGNTTSAPAAMSGGLSPEEAIPILKEVAASGLDATKYIKPVEDLYNRSSNDYFRQRFQTLLHALSMSNDPRKQTKDPQTGEKDPTASELANQLIEEIEQMRQQSEQQENQAPQQPAQTAVAHSAAFNLRAAQAKQHSAPAAPKKKKKHGGNPFKVLMGQVGKMLDHGVPDRDVVRILLKKGFWNEETITEAIHIVKDYNRKKHRSDKKEKEQKKQEKPHQVKNEMMMLANSAFNLKRYAQTSMEADGVYGIEPEWKKRSTGELIMHALYLANLLDYGKDTPQGHGKPADSKKGAKTRLSAIKSELKSRGFDEKELEKNVFRGVQ